MRRCSGRHLQPGSRHIARRPASADAVAKLGIHTSRNCTVTYWLIEALNAVTGNVDRPGGLIFNPGAIDLTKVTDPPEERKAHRSKIGNYPYIMGAYPASVLAREMTMDGPDRIRALIVEGGDRFVLPMPGNSMRPLKSSTCS